MEREDVTFASGGEEIAAWRYRPVGLKGDESHACVILAHGFGATRVARLDAFAERFAAAGLGALVFDYRHFGDSGGEPRQLLDIALQLDDWRAAVAFARGLDGVDPARIGLWGTSFSAGHVITIAAQDPVVAAVVAQSPFVDGAATLRAGGLDHVARLTLAGLRDETARLRGRPAGMIGIVGPPGAVAAMVSPDADPGYRAMFEPGEPFVNEVAARIALRVGSYRPIRRAAEVSCPLLIVICDRDVVTPPGPAVSAAARAPLGEVRAHHGGHFDIYRGEVFERAVADETEFLRRHLHVDA